MEDRITFIAERLRGLRDLLDISEEDMARATDVSLEDYREYERGERDYSFTFLFRAAGRLGIDITELLTGEMPKLSLYQYVPAGEGLPIERRKGFQYQHMAYLFKNKGAEPFVVTAKFEGEDVPIPYSTHEGQEFDYVLEGEMRMKVEDHEFLMKKGDSVIYNASSHHGMAAAGGADCKFLAIIIKNT